MLSPGLIRLRWSVYAIAPFVLVLAMPGLEIPGEFLRYAVLDTVVPHASDIDLEAALTSALEAGADDLIDVLSFIPQRSVLFFGTSRVQVPDRTPVSYSYIAKQ